MSNGKSYFVRYEKLATLVEQIWQERSPVVVRTWWTKNPRGPGMVEELIEIHRAPWTPQPSQRGPNDQPF